MYRIIHLSLKDQKFTSNLKSMSRKCYVHTATQPRKQLRDAPTGRAKGRAAVCTAVSFSLTALSKQHTHLHRHRETHGKMNT